jgi:hypothetical protein
MQNWGTTKGGPDGHSVMTEETVWQAAGCADSLVSPDQM